MTNPLANGSSPLPKSMPKNLALRIHAWDDERGGGDGIIITLKDGWCFDERGTHVFGADKVRDAIDDLRNRTSPCDCATCQAALAAAA